MHITNRSRMGRAKSCAPFSSTVKRQTIMKDFSTLSVRIAGLVLIVITLAKLPVHSMAYTIRPEYGILSYALPSIIPIVAGIILYMFPKTFSAAFVRVAPDSFKVDRPDELLRIGLILTGVALLFFSLSDIVFHSSSLAFLYYSDSYELSIISFDYPSFIATVIELIFSLALIFRARTLIEYLRKQSR